MLGSDAQAELMPSPVAGIAYPMHQLLLIAMGAADARQLLEAVGDAAALRRHWEFPLTAVPLAVPFGTGSPLNPIATF